MAPKRHARCGCSAYVTELTRCVGGSFRTATFKSPAQQPAAAQIHQRYPLHAVNACSHEPAAFEHTTSRAYGSGNSIDFESVVVAVNGRPRKSHISAHLVRRRPFRRFQRVQARAHFTRHARHNARFACPTARQRTQTFGLATLPLSSPIYR